MKNNHVHEFKMGKSKKIKICFCGKFEHANLKPEDVIVGIEAKHTPGPWETWNHFDKMNNCFPVTNANGKIEVRTDNAEADARLIAAAPELLEACINAERVFRKGPDPEAEIRALEILRDAIAKAEGK